MTTKYKIIVGFTLMGLLLIGIAALSYRTLSDGSTGFERYRAEARTAMMANAADSVILAAQVSIERFNKKYVPKMMDEARDYLLTGIAYLEETRTSEVNLDYQAQIDATIEQVKGMLSVLPDSRDSLLAAHAEVQNNTAAYGTAMNKAIDELFTLAKLSQDSRLMDLINPLYRDYSLIRSNARYFLESHEKEALELTQKALNSMRSHTDTTYAAAIDERTRRAAKALQDALDSYSKSFSLVEKHIATNEEARKKIADSITKIDPFFISYTKETKVLMTDIEEKLLSQNESSQRFLTVVSIAGVLVGVLLALWTIISIVRKLSLLARFAEQVSSGNFTSSLNIGEKGEIGSVANSMLMIPQVLNNIMNQGRQLADSVAAGSFRSRFAEKDFSGGFAELASSVNRLSDAYTLVLDAIPSPIMACSKNFEIMFLNKGAQTALGDAHCGSLCHDIIGAKECHTESCYGKRAIQEGVNSGETVLNIQGKAIDMAVASAPLHNRNGEAVAYLEVLTDISDIKKTQKQTIALAKAAMQISDRVAGASEKLARQVDEVTKGSELQTKRVESTATAMSEMNSTVLEVAKNTGYASEQSENTRSKALSGADLVEKVVQSINKVNTIATNLQANMLQLGKQAEDIGGVMFVISDIADQTNLLALNAAIEAARAGEAGRGFAVVADEVRKLAEKTMTATQEVGNTIQAIQNSTKANINEVSHAVENIGTATGLANSSGQALQEIVALATDNSEVVASIAAAAEEQSAASNEISQSIEEVSHIVAETTRGMEDAAQAVQELSQTAQELHAMMVRFQ